MIFDVDKSLPYVSDELHNSSYFQIPRQKKRDKVEMVLGTEHWAASGVAFDFDSSRVESQDTHGWWRRRLLARDKLLFQKYNVPFQMPNDNWYMIA